MTTPVTEIFEALVALPSPSRREEPVARWIADFARDLGAVVTRDASPAQHGGSTGNLRLELPAPAGAGPGVLLCAHMDTVERGDRPIRWQRQGETYTSDGDTILGADDKTGVACLLALLQEIAAGRVHPAVRVRIVLTVCEEIELLGAKALPAAWLEDLDAAIALDHSVPEEIVTSAPAKEALQITVHGVGGHACAPERRINAAHVLAQVMAQLPSGRLDSQSTCNLGILQSGTAINVIPDAASAAYELRSHDEARLDFHVQRVRDRIASLVDTSRTLPEGLAEPCIATATILGERCYHAYTLPEDALPVELARRAVLTAGGTPRLVTGHGGSDANVLNARGLPCCVLGCGLHGAHSHRERADVPEMEACVRTLQALVQGGL